MSAPNVSSLNVLPRRRLVSLEARFQHLSRRIADFSGSATAFTVALLTLVVWAVTGPLFHFSDAWQLVINTGTTIVIFLMACTVHTADPESYG